MLQLWAAMLALDCLQLKVWNRKLATPILHSAISSCPPTRFQPTEDLPKLDLPGAHPMILLVRAPDLLQPTGVQARVHEEAAIDLPTLKTEVHPQVVR